MEHSRHVRAETVSNLLPHQQAGAALTGQSIFAGESDPAQGQSRKVVTLPILQVGNHETENLSDMPKATLGDQGSEWPSQVTAHPTKWVPSMCPFTHVHK